MEEQQAKNLKSAERGALIGISAYILLSIGKLTLGNLLHSAALKADGVNNLSDIIANLVVLIGLRLARQPADTDHKFGHWKIEDIASLITSFLMFAVGFDLLWETIQSIISQDTTTVDPLGALVGILSALIMFAVYGYNTRLAKQVNSKALKAAAKDNLSDALVSLGTSLAIVAAAFRFPIVDKIAAIIITLLILRTAYGIFMESFFTLSDGFDDSQLDKYREDILKLPKITAVKSIRGRTYGSNIYLDLVLEMHPDLSVLQSHDITEQVENLLYIKYQVFDVDIHVEPAQLPIEENFENIYNKLYRLESLILAKESGWEELLSDDFSAIDSQGQQQNRYSYCQLSPAQDQRLTNFQMKPINRKTNIVTYQLSQESHTSIWRRHQTWQQVFHQATKKSD